MTESPIQIDPISPVIGAEISGIDLSVPLTSEVIYRLWKPKTRAIVEFTLYIIFFFPGVLALMLAGWDYAAESWSYGTYGEVSVMSPVNVPIFQFKSIIPVAGALLFIQGLAQCARCYLCIKTGEWPTHMEDIEEMELVLQHQHVDGVQELHLLHHEEQTQSEGDGK